jgi:hypothetical protein
MVRPLLVTALLVMPTLLGAQSHPLVGTWDVQVPAGMRMENGEATPIMAKGSYTFAIVGDSIIGTLKNDPIEGQPARPAARVATKVVAGPVTFATQSEAKLNMNGEESTRTAYITYVFEVTGDTLKGSVDRRIEGINMMTMGPQPITGTRRKE